MSGILLEAAAWLQRIHQPLWRREEVQAEAVLGDIEQGLFYLAEVDGEPGGTIKFQLEDPAIWPEIPEGTSAFVHRLAVRRCHAGGALCREMLGWAVNRAIEYNREFLRLDCDSTRPKLRAVYEAFGFEHHSDFQHGPFHVARYQLRVKSGLV